MDWRFPWDTEPAPDTAIDPQAVRPKPRGRRPAVLAPKVASGWLYHHLTVSGPNGMVEAFAAAARGPGITPWQLDFAAIEEGVFAQAASQPAHRRTLTIAGCRILARQFRERVEAHHARAAALVSVACPFDLHVLLPVPAAILQLGPLHPSALAWLAANWGVERLRQVVERPNAKTGRRLAAGDSAVGYGFFTSGETPHAAIQHLTARWPALRFQLTPRPAG
jgi:hypothetical protein